MIATIIDEPEYLHTLVHPIVSHGLPFALILLVTALFLRNPRARVVGLLGVLLSSVAVIPTVHSGRRGVDRILAMADLTGSDWLQIHRYRAEHWFWVFLAVAVLSLVSLATMRIRPHLSYRLTITTTIVTAIACAVAAYIAWPAGKVRHKEFRDDPPPQKELERALKEQKSDT